jgi:hypothetical protein
VELFFQMDVELSNGLSSTFGSSASTAPRKRSEDANLDRGVGLRSGCDCQEAAEFGGVALHNDAGHFGINIRKNVDPICVRRIPTVSIAP